MKRFALWIGVTGAVFAAALFLIYAIQEDQDVNTRIHLRATPAQVWAVLNNFQGQWNPHLQVLDEQLQAGKTSSLAETFVDTSQRIRTIHVKSIVKDYEFIWEADIAPLPRLLSAKRKLIMTPAPEGGTNLRHEMEFRGLLSGPLTGSLFADYERAMDAMNAALSVRITVAP